MKVIIKVIRGTDQPHKRRLEVEFVKVGTMPKETAIYHFASMRYKSGKVRQASDIQRDGQQRLWNNNIYIPTKEECPLTTRSFEMHASDVDEYAKWLIDSLKQHEQNNKNQ